MASAEIPGFSFTCDPPTQSSGGSASGSGAASTKGTLSASATASSPGGTPPPYVLAGSEAVAEFGNEFFFNPPPDDPSQIGTAFIGTRVDGRLKQTSSGEACISFTFGSPTCKQSSNSSPGGTAGPVSFVVTKDLDLNGATSVKVIEYVTVSAGATDSGNDSSADFSQTARAFLQLPPGWTFTSGSGDFLSYQIRVLQSGRCLDADTGSIGGNGTKVQLWDCWGGKNQSWAVNSDGTIVNLQSGRCLDADTGSIGSSGTKVQLWDCWGGQNQKWNWPGFAPTPRSDPRGSDNRNVQSGRCLDADTGTLGSNGTKVQLWDCWGGQNQFWTH